MTIHRSKGLEFPVVCVADLGRQMINRSADLVRVGRDGSASGLQLKRPGFGQRINALAYNDIRAEQWELELAEERRLFYVAMTRARERLIISGSAKLVRLGWGQRRRSDRLGRLRAGAGHRDARDRRRGGVRVGRSGRRRPAAVVCHRVGRAGEFRHSRRPSRRLGRRFAPVWAQT